MKERKDGCQIVPSLSALLWLQEHSHGHVYVRGDGLLARCGGPVICEHCKQECRIVGMLAEMGHIGSQCLPNDSEFLWLLQLNKED